MLKFDKKSQNFGEGDTPVSNTTNDTPRYEICVSCGETTDVLMAMPIAARKHYIVGCGQLCERCAMQQLGSKKAPLQHITDEMIMASLRENDKENS